MRRVLLLFFLFLALACSRKPKAARHTPRSETELPTTNADIWLNNLDGQIAELTRLVKERPELLPNLQRLSAAHHIRGRYRDDLDEIQEGVDLASTCISREPDNATYVLTRAEQEQSLHRFAQAREDLARAKQLGAPRARVADLEADLDWNDGRYDAAVGAIRRARKERPSSTTWLREAQLDHDLGDDDDADAAFAAAEDAIKDVSPLPVAHLDVQRGIVDVSRGRLEDAVVFFRAAVQRMPTHVAALEHLGETLHMLGKDDDAVAIYEKVVKLSDDPEFAHALAALYAAHGRKADADALDARARTKYDALLAKYPEAMYWHASEFFLSIGEKARALELLEKNLVLRPNSVSLVALARAQLENGRLGEARASIDKALAMPVRSALLFWTASRIYRGAGDAASADRFAAQARKLNPRIEKDG